MPSAKPKRKTPSKAQLRFCVFGDSHIACVKHAQDEGLLQLDGVDLQFWGAPGPQFRDLHFEGGKMIASSPQARDSLARINPDHVDGLAPQDFDGFLFIGCRLRTSEFIVPLLQSQGRHHVSSAVRAMMLERWLQGCRWYRAAREFAKERPVYFSPAGFSNDGIVTEDEVASTINTEASTEERQALWDQIDAAMALDEIRLLRQPEETVTRGALTAAGYATALGGQADDKVHKNGAYGALILNQALSSMRALTVPA